MRKSCIVLLLLSVLLTGCSNEPVVVPEPVYVPLREISTSYFWNNLSIQSITPVTAFESDADSLRIFPYNDNDSYIKIEKFIFSGNNAFNTILSNCDDSNKIIMNKYSLCTLTSGQSLALLPYSDEEAYLVSTWLPSAYCKKVVELLCQQLGL